MITGTPSAICRRCDQTVTLLYRRWKHVGIWCPNCNYWAAAHPWIAHAVLVQHGIDVQSLPFAPE